MRIRSLQWRLVFIFISISMTLMLVVSVFLNYSVESWIYQQFRDSIEDVIKYEGVTNENNLASLQRAFKGKYYLKGKLRSYTIINANTNKIEDSSDSRYKASKEEDLRNEILSSQNLISAMAKRDGSSQKPIKIGDSTFYDYAKRIGDYVIYCRYDKKEQEDTLADFSTIIRVSSILAILSSFILGIGFSKTITTPIGNVVQKARNIAAGDFGEAVVVKSGDEIGELTSTFNYMAGELKDKIAEISSERNKIATILNYMTDGVASFNLKGEIIHANPAFKRILDVEETDFSFNELVKILSLQQMSLESIIYIGKRTLDDMIVSYNDSYIKIYFAVFTDEMGKPEGIIAVLQDITEQQRLDDMRKDFVANVSHELRTPLTSIKTYSETLMDGALEDPETAQRFLGVINSEADRMTRLVKDLLELSRLGNKQVYLNITDVSIVGLVKGCVERLNLQAKNKDQVLESFVMGDIPEIEADRDRIEQVILNLLTNAIKYTPSGGKITAYVSRVYNEISIKVADTGIGIPKEDLPRICERFYRVDKARSREMGGTGLGLAIAKEIVEAHGGSISVASEYGKGTEITVKLPIHFST